MPTCDICGIECATAHELDSHWAGHAVRPVSSNNPLSYILCLPDGVCPGRYEAAEAFARAAAELKGLHPDVEFNFFPFAYVTDPKGRDPVLTTILAIAK